MNRPQPTAFRRRDDGFSILEIVMTAVLLSVALIPIFGYFHAAPRQTAQTMHRALALNLAGRLVERFRALPYDVLQARFGQGEAVAQETLASDPLVSLDALPEAMRTLTSAYQYSQDVVFEAVPGEAGLGLLKVYVRWKLGDVPPREVGLSRVVVDYARIGSATPSS